MSARWRLDNSDILKDRIKEGRISAEDFRKASMGGVAGCPASPAVEMSDALAKVRDRLFNLIERLPPRDPHCPHEAELMRFLKGDAKTVSLFESSQEHLEQTAFFYALKRLDPTIYDLAFSVPNGGFRKKGERFRIKAEGQKTGIPDVLMIRRTKKYIGLALEFKRFNGRPSDVSAEQRKVHQQFQEEGWFVAVAYGYGQALKTVREYFDLPTIDRWRY